MDSNTEAQNFLPSSHHNYVYHETKEEDIIIDLGLSLRTSLQPEPYNPSGNFVNSAEYGDLMVWPQMNSYLNLGNPTMISEDCDDETEGVQSKERWIYVKVNMEGVIIGRKICIVDLAGYASLALQLEEMFGRHCVSGLRLFEPGSEFSLCYKDTNDNWRTVGDVPWKDFVDCVKRLRIARNG